MFLKGELGIFKVNWILVWLGLVIEMFNVKFWGEEGLLWFSYFRGNRVVVEYFRDFFLVCLVSFLDRFWLSVGNVVKSKNILIVIIGYFE